MSSKNASKKYTKLSQREHVLVRPGMYIGEVIEDENVAWIFDDTNKAMDNKNIKYVSGLYKIFDEILVNAIDHVSTLKSDNVSKKVKEIKVNINDNGEISVFNDGEGIPIEVHDEHKIYIPEMLFGNMLTSTNYDDSMERTTGGQNGIGAKACNIFSKMFVIETVDSNKKKYYKQVFTDNMENKSAPEISRYTKYPFTKITFLPDYNKFGLKGLTSDMKSLFKKRVYDVCALTDSNIKVYLNDEKIEIKSFEKYVNLYLNDNSPKIFNTPTEKCEICVSHSLNGFMQMSFCNGICTQKGGKHVDHVLNQVIKKLTDLVYKRKKINLKSNHIKDQLFIFLKIVVVNPKFDSQTKDTLTTPYNKFGTKIDIDDKLIEKLYKTEVVEKAISLSNIDQDKNAKKTDGKKKSSIRVNKLDDANHAGTSKSNQCHLILTEGDSAKTMAVSGLSEVGRDKYGCFPLKGKVMNVKDTKKDKIWANEEINNLKKIIGLETGKTYTDTKDLRYGNIILMTDSDVDGSHIKGLIFNMFHTLWPSLLKVKGFLTSIMTPIVKVSKGKISKKFYNLTEYENWKESISNASSWSIKYYKGLGTSTSKEAKEYFKEMNILTYDYENKDTDKSLNLAFLKDKSDERKKWISEYDKNRVISFDKDKNNTVGFSSYVNDDLIHYSVYNLERSIPSIADGFKKSIRKIIFCCLKRKLHNEIKVAQLSGYVSEHGAYHHGETSLQEAIIGLAQDFVGSNNVNLLMPNGQFGSRIEGGKDNASPRYIFTCLNSIVKHIFKEDDNNVLTYLEDDGTSIEPEFYVPVIPTILVNGAIGIGTGYSTSIPSYNPKDIIVNLKNMLNDKDTIEMKPWYKNFKGTVTENYTKGSYKKVSPTKIEVTELPVGYWTSDFKNHLDDYIDKNNKVLKDYESHYTETEVKFILHFNNAQIVETLLQKDGTNEELTKFDKEFKMTTTKPVNTNNMHLFDRNGIITKYPTVYSILEEFYDLRYEFYEKRKAYKLKSYESELEFINNKIKFILAVISKKLRVLDKKKEVIIAYLESEGFIKIDNSYDYLIKMPIYNLTFEKKEELLNLHENKVKEYEKYKSKSIKKMWLEDLQDIEKALENKNY